ncbi:MAG TPA: ABC transporter ATP-binding protein [Candidatus Limnocylindria bacterium]|nr:ABC transporter ATP-binding protein [Candidatus Limnocylindria bacterium]
MPVLEVTGACKTYTRFRKPPEKAVDDLDLVVEQGGVHGFLGPNGSGKTTTIRMLLGLVGSDGGDLRVFGRPVPEALPEVIPHIGALVETPLFFPNFSARLNLRLLADVAGVPAARVEECLEIVELRDRADDRFKGYSLGMKQRLGIAAALLKAPRLLILDEPSNGLDPAGIRDVRELLRRLGSDGRTTVFLSSHLLGEVQQVCDHVTILARGRRVAHGAVSEVLASSTTADVRLRVADPMGAHAVLEAAGYRLTSLGDSWAVHDVPDPAAITRTLADAGHYLSELSPMAADLESVFLELTGDGLAGSPADAPADAPEGGAA